MERIDDLQWNGLRIIQDTELFCFGTDAVLLAGFARVKRGERVVDLGTGTGILPILLAAEQPEARFLGVEIQEALCGLSRRSVALNGQQDRVEIRCCDLADAPGMFGHGYDVVVTNPPYEAAGDGAARGGESHRIARKELCVTLDGVCTSAAALLRTGGRLYMVYKAARLAELIYQLKQNKLEPKVLRMVGARAQSEPHIVLLQAVKGAREGLRVLPPLAIYGADGKETPEIRKIYHME